MCEHENIIKRAEATASRMLGEGDQHAATTIQELLEALAEETEAAENWRRLALQFDNHRMQALGHLKAVVNPGAVFDAYKAAKAFLNAPPLGGEEVLAQRLAELAATPAAVDMGIPMSESDAPAVLPEPAAWLATFRPKGMLSSHSVAGTNLEELKRSVPSGSKFKPLYAQPAYYRNALPPYGVVSAEEHWAETEHAKHYGLEHLVPRREPFEFEKDERGAQQ